jgi:hypothetical protein
MQKALIFILALVLILFIAFSKPKEGFTDLMGVNWSDMNKGTPAALYTKLPIKQPRVVNLAEAGVGNIQPSPPPPGTLPSAPAPQRSLESPNPYIDPVNEPAKYIRILGVKEDLQAFFGFQAFMLEERNDPAIQIPLCRARADMAELINVQSVMERNPGLPSRINNKQINDIQANLNYLRDILHELESSGAIQPQAPIEGFQNMPSSSTPQPYDRNNPLMVYIKEYFDPIYKLFDSKINEFGLNITEKQQHEINKEGLKWWVDAVDSNSSELPAPDNSDILNDGYLKIVTNFMNDILKYNNIPPTTFAPVIPYNTSLTIQTVRSLIQNDPRTREPQQMNISGPPSTATSNQQPLSSTASRTPSMGSIPPSSTNLSTQYTTASMPSSPSKRASLKELQEFQVKVVIEIQRLQASGTSDPVLNGRINTLTRIKDDVDQVISQLQSGFLIPETVPIFSSDIERALPLLAKPSDPLPSILRENNLPPAVANLFPGGLSPKDTEQAQQINNVVKGYMDNIFEGTSWGLNLGIRYDNPNIAKLQAKKAQAEATTAKLQLKNKNVSFKNKDAGLDFLIERTVNSREQGTGMPGMPFLQPNEIIDGYDRKNPTQGAAVPNFRFTDSTFDLGLPGITTQRTAPNFARGGRLDWKQRSQQIKEQIRLRGMNPADFGALPDDAVVGDEFSWRGYTQMMCMRLNTTTDPGLAETAGCPPQDWQGWRD